jgi:hypothetical protein
MGLEGRIGVSSCLLTHASRAARRTSVVKVAGVIVGRAGRMSGAGPKRARGGQANHPRGSHQLENVTPSESALIHIRLLSNDLVAATIADPGKDRSSTHYDPSLEVRIGSPSGPAPTIPMRLFSAPLLGQALGARLLVVG